MYGSKKSPMANANASQQSPQTTIIVLLISLFIRVVNAGQSEASYEGSLRRQAWFWAFDEATARNGEACDVLWNCRAGGTGQRGS